jgi:hypothetical protein
VMLTTHPHLVPMLRKRWAIPPLTPWVLLGLLGDSPLRHKNNAFHGNHVSLSAVIQDRLINLLMGFYEIRYVSVWKLFSKVEVSWKLAQ